MKTLLMMLAVPSVVALSVPIVAVLLFLFVVVAPPAMMVTAGVLTNRYIRSRRSGKSEGRRGLRLVR